MAKKKGASIRVGGSIPKITLEMPLDEKKIKEIQKCIEKGHLRLTISKVDLVAGKIADPWLYD
jgi:hypothetical protein